MRRRPVRRPRSIVRNIGSLLGALLLSGCSVLAAPIVAPVHTVDLVVRPFLPDPGAPLFLRMTQEDHRDARSPRLANMLLLPVNLPSAATLGILPGVVPLRDDFHTGTFVHVHAGSMWIPGPCGGATVSLFHEDVGR